MVTEHVATPPSTGLAAAERPIPDLRGRRALVTGGAGGIGRAVAQRLALGGAAVTVVDLDTDAAAAVADDIGGEPIGVDLSDLTGLAGLGATTDILVNNAGLQYVAPLTDFPPDKFSLMLRVMLEAPFRLAQSALPHMYQQGFGRIVNISSVHGRRASPYKAAYVAAKHGLEGLSKVIALEGAAHGVTSNCIAPSYVRTPLVEGQIADQARSHAMSPQRVVEEVMLAPSAIKRLIEPEEVAEMVAYLCSPHAAFITGTSFAMDGGWTAH